MEHSTRKHESYYLPSRVGDWLERSVSRCVRRKSLQNSRRHYRNNCEFTKAINYAHLRTVLELLLQMPRDRKKRQEAEGTKSKLAFRQLTEDCEIGTTNNSCMKHTNRNTTDKDSTELVGLMPRVLLDSCFRFTLQESYSVL